MAHVVHGLQLPRNMRPKAALMLEGGGKKKKAYIYIYLFRMNYLVKFSIIVTVVTIDGTPQHSSRINTRMGQEYRRDKNVNKYMRRVKLATSDNRCRTVSLLRRNLARNSSTPSSVKGSLRRRYTRGMGKRPRSAKIIRSSSSELSGSPSARRPCFPLYSPFSC